MISILCIGSLIALVVFAIVLKTCTSEPKKAQKAEKAAIMKQLLALSERENNVSAIASSRSRTPLTNPGMRPAEFPRKLARNSQAVHSSQGRC
jgi:hypothetical protein